jgi:L-threonylcarbamoyladenylate synthase
MQILLIDDDDIKTAADSLRSGGLVAFPTETVYGLGADAFNSEALARVFEAKGRPRFDPLIVHIASLDAVNRVANLNALSAEARRIFGVVSAKLWPGPLTVILPKQAEVPDLATSGLPTVAVRFPAHPVAQRLIALSTGAVAAPSANPFGRLSPTTAEHVRDGLGNRVDFIIDGGPAQVGVESTVLDLSALPPRILRPGGVSREALEALIGPVLLGPAIGLAEPGADAPHPAPAAPGQLTSHYAPRTPLLLHTQAEMAALPYKAGEARLFFSAANRRTWKAAQSLLLDKAGPDAAIQALSETGDTRQAAANLFQALHRLDALGLALIHAERAPDAGLGPAINDRLERAAHGPQKNRRP